MIRIGCGFDVHAFAAGRRLVLGGVEIPHCMGLAGHSDADLLSHAVCDALFGALALGDIGAHFPDNDGAYKNINSLRLLSMAAQKIAAAGGKIINIDASVVLQEPKIIAAYFGDARKYGGGVKNFRATSWRQSNDFGQTWICRAQRRRGGFCCCVG